MTELCKRRWDCCPTFKRDFSPIHHTVVFRLSRLRIAWILLGAAPVLGALGYRYRAIRAGFGNPAGLAVCAAMPLQLIAVPFLVPVLRGSAPLRWMTRAFAVFMVWATAAYLHFSHFYMAYNTTDQIGPGRWLLLTGYCIHAVGLLLLPRMGPMDSCEDSSSGSR